MLALILLAAALSGGIVAALIVINPAVEASIETELPLGPLELGGNVTSKPIVARVGTLHLGWNPYGPQRAHPIRRQSVSLDVHLSRQDCRRLAQIGGACGPDHAKPLRDLESLRVQGFSRSLHVGVNASASPRAEVEQVGETAHRGAPFEWNLRNYAPTLAITLSCAQALAIDVTAESSHPGPRLPSQPVTCRPRGVRYDLEIIDEGPIVTTVGFDRVRQFQSVASADRGGVTIGHGTVSVDGDSSPLAKPTTVALDAEPRSSVSSQVVSPAANAPTEVSLTSREASHMLVGEEERTPDEFDRIPEGVRYGVPIPIAASLLGALVSLIFRSRRRQNLDA
ncbi:MAG: hypothetical protein QM729_07375 [Solirubrobacterales bacterium]